MRPFPVLAKSLIPALSLTLSLNLALHQGRALATEPAERDHIAFMTAAYNSGDYKTAFDLGCRLLKKEPDNLTVHYLLGNCYLKLGQKEQAAAEYKYCQAKGGSSQVAKYAAQALSQLSGAPAEGQPAESETAAEPTGPPPDKTDLQILEYKERLLKTGADMIAANKVKLERQLDALHRRTEDAIDNLTQQAQNSLGRGSAGNDIGMERERLLQEEKTRTRQMQEDNENEERRITAYYQSQVDKVSSQKGNLTSQVKMGKSDLRLVPKGSDLFVRNYINFHGEPPPPPPPPELRATAKKLNPDKTTADKKAHE